MFALLYISKKPRFGIYCKVFRLTNAQICRIRIFVGPIPTQTSVSGWIFSKKHAFFRPFLEKFFKLLFRAKNELLLIQN